MKRRAAGLLLVLSLVAGRVCADALPGFSVSPHFEEQVREIKTDNGVRMIINAPAADKFDPARPTLLVFFTTPNGNSIEQTLGCQYSPGMDFHWDIQHIAAQTRRLREVDDSRNVVVTVLEADTRSWPAWRAKHPENGALIREIVADVAALIPGKPLSIDLTGHSGGGSFIFGFLNGGEKIEDCIERIAWLDANYGYSEEDHHGEKLLTWLKTSPQKHLAVLAYDDRNIELQGKKVLKNPLGGTFGSSHRMIDYFNNRSIPLASSRDKDFETFFGLDNQIRFFIHTNPQNKILHTLLVGEMNGYLHALTLDTPLEGKWGTFGGPRAYTKWIQPAEKSAASKPASQPATSAKIPPRPVNALGGKALMLQLAAVGLAEREETISKEISGGNIPEFLRKFKTIDLKSAGHTAQIQVMPDYLALGSNDDFVRIPMLPGTAQRIADALGCSLTTRKLCDDIYRAADVKLVPKPMDAPRETVERFLEHNQLIEQQRGNKPLGALVAGIKKDIVITNRLKEKPHKVAIYGWHQPDGKAIQPLYVGHADTYVDYSHGVRLVNKTMRVDGKEMSLDELLKIADLAPLVSDEGPIDPAGYPN